MDKLSGLYEIVNEDLGKRYVGSSADIHDRWNRHRRLLRKNVHPNPHLQRAWNKYGKDVFKFRVVKEVESGLLVEEQKILDHHLESDSWDRLYNISKEAKRPSNDVNPWAQPGQQHPAFGQPRSDEICEKISEAKKNAPHPLRGKSAEDNDHWLSFEGHEWREERREKMSQIMSGKGNPMHGKTGEDAPMYGVTGEDHPRHGKTFTPEQRARRSKALSGENNPFYGQGEQFNGEGNPNSKLSLNQALWILVLREKTDMTYSEIAENLPISSSTVSHVALGYKWSSAQEIFNSWNLESQQEKQR